MCPAIHSGHHPDIFVFSGCTLPVRGCTFFCLGASIPPPGLPASPMVLSRWRKCLLFQAKPLVSPLSDKSPAPAFFPSYRQTPLFHSYQPPANYVCFQIFALHLPRLRPNGCNEYSAPAMRLPPMRPLYFHMADPRKQLQRTHHPAPCSCKNLFMKYCCPFPVTTGVLVILTLPSGL